MNTQINFFTVSYLEVSFEIDDQFDLNTKNNHKEITLEKASFNIRNLKIKNFSNGKESRKFDYISKEYGLDRRHSRLYNRHNIREKLNLLDRSSSDIRSTFHNIDHDKNKVTKITIFRILANVFQSL